MRKYQLLSSLSIILYAINSLGLSLRLWDSSVFLKNHLNDLLCLPAVIPVMFLGFYYTRIRKTPYPAIAEIILHLIIWTIIFEMIGPWFMNQGVSDLYDVICYVIGAGLLILTVPKKHNELSSSGSVPQK